MFAGRQSCGRKPRAARGQKTPGLGRGWPCADAWDAFCHLGSENIHSRGFRRAAAWTLGRMPTIIMEFAEIGSSGTNAPE